MGEQPSETKFLMVGLVILLVYEAALGTGLFLLVDAIK